MKDFGLYLIITKPVLSYREVAEAAVRNDIRMLQLREKHLNDNELLAAAREIREVTSGTNTLLVINDRPDIALLCEADVLHLGQNDISVKDARKIVGDDMLIGLSTHSFQQAKDALAHNPDYIGFGPIYKTPTKVNPDPTVGTDNLREIVSVADEKNVPVIAIGGIFPESIPTVLEAGARNICMVRYFMESNDLDERIKKIKEMIN